MTQDEIVKMAREAGLIRAGDGWTEPHRWGLAEIERFAALVAAHEREACAKVCDEQQEFVGGEMCCVAMNCAAAIRSRT